ncbi:MAG: alginate export family protein [Candidatus Rokuibacteriota bacterium]|nr:MAG: alginate export family protein [Candidatus Rokubacteria bacterium]
MLCMVLIAFVPGAASAACPSTRPSFQTLRYEEDYSFLRDPDCRTDVWDRIKYMPLNEAGDVYLSLGGDLRERYEYFHNAQWGQGPQDPDGFLTQRYMAYLDLHLWPWGRFFGQLKSNLESGRTGGPRPTDRDELDVHQVFVDLSLPPDPQYALTLRTGRQELAYGSQRIISVREGPNVRQSFDAVRGILRYGSWRVDAFVSQPAETNEGIFDDKTDQKRRLWGVYAVGPSPAGQVLNLDTYYLGFRRQDAKFDTGIIAHELRHSLGIRLWGRAGDWDYNLEALDQFGKFGRSEIQAWTAASDIGYTLSGLPLTPRLGLKADIISGDRDRDDRTLGTFNALFPKGAYFGSGARAATTESTTVRWSCCARVERAGLCS